MVKEDGLFYGGQKADNARKVLGKDKLRTSSQGCFLKLDPYLLTVHPSLDYTGELSTLVIHSPVCIWGPSLQHMNFFMMEGPISYLKPNDTRG